MENYEYTRPPVNRNNGAKIKRLKRKNKAKSIWICILVFIILALLGVMGYFGAKSYKEKYKAPSYKYIPMTEEASARAFVWLKRIDDIDLSYEEVKECMGSFNLEVIRKPTEVKGEYTYELVDGAYGYCESQAKIGLEKAYYLAIKKRITNSGYEGEVNNELVDRIMDETFGMSVSEYLNKHDIKLLPEINEIDIEEKLGLKAEAMKEGTNEENN